MNVRLDNHDKILDDHELRLRGSEKFEIRLVAFVAGAAAVASFLGSLALKLLS